MQFSGLKQRVHILRLRFATLLEDGFFYAFFATYEWYFLTAIILAIFRFIFYLLNLNAPSDLLYNLFIIVGVLVILQTIWLNRVRNKADYIKFLPYATIEKRKYPGSERKQYRDARLYFTAHLKAIRRGINRESYGRFRSLFSISLWRMKIEDAGELRYNDIVVALNYHCTDSLSHLPKSEWRTFFSEYASKYEGKFHDDTPLAIDWVNYVLEQYGSIPIDVKEAAKSHRNRRLVRRLEGHYQILAIFVPIINTLVLLIIFLFFGIKLSI